MPTKKKSVPAVDNYQAQYDEAYALDYDDLFRRALVDDRDARKKRRAGDTTWSTPVLDAFRTRHKEKLTMKGTTKKTAAAKPSMRDTIRFTRNGMPVHESHMLGGIAYHYSYDCGSNGPDKKWDSKQLEAWLNKNGVPDVSKPGWTKTLPNGEVIGTIRVEQVDEYRKKAMAAKKAASNGNGAAKKTAPAKPAAKATGVTKKPAGKTTGASKPSVKGPKTPAALKRADAKKSGTAPAKKAATSSARAKAGVKPIPKGTAKKTAARK